MKQINWAELKSGTDIRGVAIEGKDTVNLTDEAIDAIVRAFCYRLATDLHKKQLTVAVGHDSRLSAERISKCVISALTNSGCNVLFTGLSSTPSMFMLLKEPEFAADASIMITASHLPFDKNGLKFFTLEGGAEGKDISEILNLARQGKSLSGSGSVRYVNYIDRYSESLVKLVREKTGKEFPLSGKKIIVDAGNGAGGFYVEKVLKPLGADTQGSQFLDPDGTFPNHIPNPEDKTAMQSVCKRALETKADFAIIFDTDVDRAGAVDKSGEEINRNKLIALISAILLSEQSGATIVTDSVTSDGLTNFIESRGGKHRRFKRGYKNVIDEAKRLCDEGIYAPLAIETSGHAALKENYFLDDGAYLVTRILIKLAQLSDEGKDIADLISDLPQPKEAAEIRLGFTPLGKEDFKNYGNAIIEKIRTAIPHEKHISLADNSFEGVRMNFDASHGDGWALVRMSLHEPILPVNFESNSSGGCLNIAKALLSLLSPYQDKLDLTNLKNYISQE